MNSRSTPGKLGIVTSVAPPSPTGQSVVLERLLREVSGDRYCLIVSQPIAQDANPHQGPPLLQGSRHQAPVSNLRRRLSRLLLPKIICFGLHFVWLLLLRCRAIRRIVAAQGCSRLLACSGDLMDLPAAYLAAKMSGIPYFVYAFDWYSHQVRAAFPWGYRIARSIERRVLRSACRVFVPNEFLADEYRLAYGIEAVVIRNPIESGADAVVASASRWRSIQRSDSPELRIAYTGSVYQAQADAIQNLARALARPESPSARLQLYVHNKKFLAELDDPDGRVEIYPHLAPDDARHVQRESDILFLPLAFDSPYPDIIRTSAPAKLGEYLASGVPILAHAPHDAFLTWFIKRHECGLAVDRPNAEMLASAVRRLAEDATLREKLVRNARRAADEFDIERARRPFLELTGLSSQPSGGRAA